MLDAQAIAEALLKLIAPAEKEAEPTPARYGAPSYYAPPTFYGAAYYQPYYPRFQPYPAYGGYHGVSVEPLKEKPKDLRTVADWSPLLETQALAAAEEQARLEAQAPADSDKKALLDAQANAEALEE